MKKIAKTFIYLISCIFTVLIIALAAFLEIVSAESPIVASETPTIQAYLTQKLQHPVEIHSVSLEWHGIIPVIDISKFAIYSEDHKQTLFYVGMFPQELS